VLGVECRILGEDEDIIKENDNEIVQVRSEDVVHCTLECGWCVGETEWHYLELVVPVACSECGFGDICL
jgi:hypothetical protein